MSYLKEMAEQGYNPGHVGQFHHTMMPYLAKLLNIGPDDLIIDVGAAQGHCCIPLKEAGYTNIAVVDIDSFNFDLFTKRYRFKCFRCDVEKDRIPVEDKTTGLIIAFHLIEHISDPTFFLNECYRVLDHKRAIAIVTPDWRKQYRSFYRDPTHVRPYDKESISRILRMVGFKEILTQPWGSAYGLGKLKAYKWFPKLGMIGLDLLAIGWKE